MEPPKGPSGPWIDVVVGLAVVAATLLTGGLEPAAFWFSLLDGLLLAACAAYAASKWASFTPGRRVGLSLLAAFLAFALLVEWWSADFPVTLRRVMIFLGLVGTVAGLGSAWTSRAAA